MSRAATLDVFATDSEVRELARHGLPRPTGAVLTGSTRKRVNDVLDRLPVSQANRFRQLYCMPVQKQNGR